MTQTTAIKTGAQAPADSRSEIRGLVTEFSMACLERRPGFSTGDGSDSIDRIPCTRDAGHTARGEDHQDALGRMWPVRTSALPTDHEAALSVPANDLLFLFRQAQEEVRQARKTAARERARADGLQRIVDSLRGQLAGVNGE